MTEVIDVLIVRTMTSLSEVLAQVKTALHLRRGVSADAMEHDDGVVERVADDGEQRRDDVGGDLHVEEQTRPGVDAQHDDHVMEQADERDDAHARFAVADGDDGEDAQA